MNKLWTKDFTILTLGTVVSMLGNSVSGFAIGLLALDYTGSTFLFAVFMVTYNFPKVIMPLISGPFLDKFSRKKIIYSLDFLSAGLYLLLFFLIQQNIFNYPLLLVGCLILGSIDSVYSVAYESFYPNLVSEGNYSKAYSISSIIFPLTTVMVPIAARIYDMVGIAPLFLFNAITFFIAAVFETQIKK